MMPAKLLIVSLREVHRAKQMHLGFIYASTKYPNSPFAIGLYVITLGTYIDLTPPRLRDMDSP